MTVSRYLATSPVSKNDTRLFLRYVCGLSESQIFTQADRELSQEEKSRLDRCVSLSADGKPTAYIIGYRDFWRYRFKVTEGVLIPQPDTETLVENAISSLKKSRQSHLRILDLCAGSGCIGVSVAKELSESGKKTELTLSDISRDAYRVFSENAGIILKNTGVVVKCYCADLFDAVNVDVRENGKYNAILTNPPYIRTDVICTLSKQVQSEPHIALDGGADGLDLIRKIVSQAANFLTDNGLLLCEIGYDQGNEVKELFENAGYRETHIICDLGGRERVVSGIHRS
ncbi:MAG: peptide chain release factor N(5)-glutamine methyltransferase [Sphaerochaetaceae bacterium]|nr:peptide chain release factor N(5)-glutamine methyltransferase [Sphaerochaetaceae bacterium]